MRFHLGARFPQSLQLPISARLCRVGSEEGRAYKIQCLLEFCPSRCLNGQVCRRCIAIKQFEFRNGFDG